MYYFFAIWFLNCFAFSCFARVLIFSRYKFCFCFEVKQLRSSSLWLEDSTFEKMSVRNVGSLIIFRRRVLAPGCPFVAESLPLCHAVARWGGGAGAARAAARRFRGEPGPRLHLWLTGHLPSFHPVSPLFFRALQNSRSTPLDLFPTTSASPPDFLSRTSGEPRRLPRSGTRSS